MQVAARPQLEEDKARCAFGLEGFGSDLYELIGTDDVLVENNKRFVLFPINYHDIWSVYKRAEALFWTSEDINFSRDAATFKALSREANKDLLSVCLAYMSLQNTFEKYPLEGRLCDEVQAPEARCAFGFFMMQKNIHMEMFSVLLTKIFDQDSTALSHLVSSIEVLPYLQLRRSFVEAYIDDPSIHFSIKLVTLISMVSLCSRSITLILLLASSGAASSPQMEPERDIASQPMPNLLYGLAKINKDTETFIDFLVLLFKENMKTRPKSEIVHHVIADTMGVEFKLLENIANSSGAPENIVSTVRSTIRSYAGHIAERLGYRNPYPQPQGCLTWVDSYLAHVLVLHEPTSDTTTTTHLKGGPSINEATAAFTIIDDF